MKYGKLATCFTTYLAATLVVCAGNVFAHEHEHHKGEHSDARMMKLHAIMHHYGPAQARIDTAFAKGDLTAVRAEIEKMIETVPDLKNARPHKGLDHLEGFRKLAAGFGRDLEQTHTLVKQGDLNGAKLAFSRAGEKCASCHAKFRD